MSTVNPKYLDIERNGVTYHIPVGVDPTTIIDDTTGSGDTDKVWSANKLVTELAKKVTGNKRVWYGTATGNSGLLQMGIMEFVVPGFDSIQTGDVFHIANIPDCYTTWGFGISVFINTGGGGTDTGYSVRTVTGEKVPDNEHLFAPGCSATFVYNGDYIILVNATHASTTYHGITKLENSSSSSSTTTALVPAALKSVVDNRIVPLETSVAGKADKDTDAVEGNFASFDSSGNPVDSGHKHSDYITSHQDISGKADKVSGATSGNFAGLDSNGNLTDSGKSASDFLGTSAIDDTAGTGVTDKTWSADKLSGEMSATEDFRNETISDPDTIPYIFRQTGNIGDKTGLKDKLIGGTVAWNQGVVNGNFANADGWEAYRCSLSTSNNILSITIATAGVDYPAAYRNMERLPADHKVLSIVEAKGNSGNKIIFGTEFQNSEYQYNATGDWQTLGYLYNQGTNRQVRIGCVGSSCSVDQVLQFKNMQTFDLTQMFGSAIADALYTMEQTTAGSGVAWFRNLFSDDYYAYNAGEMMSVKASGHRTTGKNLIAPEPKTVVSSGLTFVVNKDGSVDVSGTPTGVSNVYISQNIPISSKLGSITLSGLYQTNMQWNTFYLMDKNDTIIATLIDGSQTSSANKTFDISGYTSAVKAKLSIKRVSNVETNTTVYPMISVSGTGTTWEPYESHTYPLDPIELRGLPVLTNGVLSYDGDTYEPDGTVTRKYGIVDLGTLTWTDYQTNCKITNDLQSIVKKPASGAEVANIFATNYLNNIPSALVADQTTKKQISINVSGTLLTSDGGVSATPSGYMIYELATPTTESAEPFDAAQKVDPNGTMEYIDTRSVQIPVGHNGVYGHYLRMKAEDAPTRDTVNEMIAPVRDEVDDTQTALAIVIDGDTAPSAIASGKYLFIKNHSTLARGPYHATSAILSGASITSNNTSPDSDGVANAINANIPEVVDNLTTQDATKALSANQGYALNSKLANIKAESFTLSFAYWTSGYFGISTKPAGVASFNDYVWNLGVTSNGYVPILRSVQDSVITFWLASISNTTLSIINTSSTTGTLTANAIKGV